MTASPRPRPRIGCTRVPKDNWQSLRWRRRLFRLPMPIEALPEGVARIGRGGGLFGVSLPVVLLIASAASSAVLRVRASFAVSTSRSHAKLFSSSGELCAATASAMKSPLVSAARSARRPWRDVKTY